MDQATLERLIAARAESRCIDYKLELDWGRADRGAKLEIIRDILAMSNTPGGGSIILGVRDGDFEPVGLPENAFNSFDQTRVHDLLQNYTDPRHFCRVQKFVINGKRFVLLEVPEFSEIPIICAANENGRDGSVILRRGQLYIRTEAAATVALNASEDMRELLERATTRVGRRLFENFLGMLNPEAKRQFGAIFTGESGPKQGE
jgi:predicted HTH transcriptional regulator